MQNLLHFKAGVCGASAGGVEALSGLFMALAAELSAASFVVLHIPAHTQSGSARVLGREATMPIATPQDGWPLSQPYTLPHLIGT